MKDKVGLRSTSRLRVGALTVAFLALATAAPGLSPEKASAATLRYSYQGSAYGTSLSVGSTLSSGPSAPLSMGCNSNPDFHARNSTTGLNRTGVSTGAVLTTADTYASPVRSRTTAATSDVNLLSNRIRATTIKAASHTIKTSTGYAFSTSGTTFAGLVINNRAVTSNPAPNTRITIPGFGYVLLNQQIRRANGLTVVALQLFVTETNPLGVRIGTKLVVSSATTALSGPVAGVLGGYGYGTRVDSSAGVVSGQTFTAGLGCLGTGDKVITNTGSGVDLDDVADGALTTGTITNTAQGAVRTTGARGTTTSTVERAELIDGLVTASAIKASAYGSTDGAGNFRFSDFGTSFGSLAVRGFPAISPNVARNTIVDLPGVGRLYLRQTDVTSRSITVIMIRLVLSQPVDGLPTGTDIKIGVTRTIVG